MQEWRVHTKGQGDEWNWGANVKFTKSNKRLNKKIVCPKLL